MAVNRKKAAKKMVTKKATKKMPAGFQRLSGTDLAVPD